VPRDVADDESLDFVVGGLDTFATVWVNGTKCHTSENGFMPYRIDITEQANGLCGLETEMLVHFASAFRRGRQLE